MRTALRTLAFGQLDSARVWGAAWIQGIEEPGLAFLGSGTAPGAAARLRLTADGDGGGEEWRMEAEGGTLAAAPVVEPVAVGASEEGIDGREQLCRVTGRFEHGGLGHDVDCLGVRTWWADTLDLDRYESVRAVSVWFDPAEAMALTAFRPRKAKAHDRDVLAAAVIAADGWAPVEDPRLSTTYGRDGWPARAGLELWLAGEEDERQYPRRASGEALGARVEALAGGVELRAEPFRWHSRGRDGAGMYLLARRR